MKKQKKTAKEITIRSSAAEYLTFVSAAGGQETAVELRYEDENVWLTQRLMAEIYGVDVRTINEHLKNIFTDSELDENSVIRKFRITAADGKNYDTKHYNLQAIIAVGFKVGNERAVQFRKWAGQIIKDYTIQGWVMDTPRLKNGHKFTNEFFERQLAVIREIRASERMFYQKVTDIYATAVDYDTAAKSTQRFFATVQNKLHWAIHGQTAAEVIVSRADAVQERMGLTTWEAAPKGKIQKYDVAIAKNYLTDGELEQLERLVSAYLDLAELQTERKIPMTMADWENRLNQFLELADRKILRDAGRVSMEIAKAHAESEFEKYRIVQDALYVSDFDALIQSSNVIDGKAKKQARKWKKK